MIRPFPTSNTALTARVFAALAGAAVVYSTQAFAQLTPGGITMQPPNSALAEEVHHFHNGVLLPIITFICIFVLGLLTWVVVKYNARANPTPRKFSHNTLVEVLWTGIPIMILLFIALPSFELLYKEDIVPDGKQVSIPADGATTEFAFANDFPESRMVRRKRHVQVFLETGGEMRELKRRTDYRLDGLGEQAVIVAFNEAPSAGETVVIRGGRSVDQRGDVVLAPSMTLKVTGYQWNWSYAYPDFGDFEFFSNMAAEDQTTPELYRLEVDNRFLVPVGETIRITTTAKDVIHAFALPAFAIKIDAVPGRINETWFRADREGVFYGQCSEICGIKHAFMPIAVEVVSRDKFEAWVDSQRAVAGLDPMFQVAGAPAAGAAKLAALAEDTTAAASAGADQ
ncbi:MAG: cytochrome c oxidase subunit II transmembrane domain-containing protein [Pseudomonadota bacterium]